MEADVLSCCVLKRTVVCRQDKCDLPFTEQKSNKTEYVSGYKPFVARCHGVKELPKFGTCQHLDLAVCARSHLFEPAAEVLNY